jgi:quercetin dioxygenase-like cupin family protein
MTKLFRSPRRLLVLGSWIAGGALAVALWPAESQQAAPTENKGVKIDQFATIDLGPEIDGMQGRELRLRRVTIEPGGIIGEHSHKDRPAVARIVQGTLTEHRAGGYVKDHPEGNNISVGKDVTHWEENKGSKPTVLIVGDIAKK